MQPCQAPCCFDLEGRWPSGEAVSLLLLLPTPVQRKEGSAARGPLALQLCQKLKWREINAGRACCGKRHAPCG